MLAAAALAKPAVGWGDIVVRFVVAVALVGAVGVEREIAGQPAGLRTHITVGLGAALFGLISVHGFDAYVAGRNTNNYQIDVSRVASQVVVGVGFLGAGAILKEGASIRGLTTAASLWASAAIGLACGLGSFFAAVATTVALLLSLIFLRAPRGWVRRRLARSLQTVIIHLRHGANPSELVSALHEIDGCDVKAMSIRRDDDGLTIEADLKAGPQCDLESSLGKIAESNDVTGLDLA
ncbi:MAG: MgtC/SapB family protein [Acidimicrobiia bacterium]|nr:MgtC/SapB family protein [Acidimicrobiia bacterium]MBV9411243.1 MgtC/SapB family protein [Acidimicrobiia bacterium]